MPKIQANSKSVFRHYAFPIILLISVTLGSIIGLVFKNQAAILKPLGDIFLNLLFTTVVPLVFFSIASAVASISDLKKLGRIFFWMMVLFTLTGLISASLMLVTVKIFPPVSGTLPALAAPVEALQNHTPKIVEAFTVPDFIDLLTKKNMLAMILFSMLVGFASSSLREKAKPFADFLEAGNQVMLKVVSIIMLYAPVGLCAYFAYLTGVFGPELMGSYLRAVLIYYPFSVVYFFIFYSLYAWLAAGNQGVVIFWKKISLPSLVALGTGSSMATIPSNIEAADQIGVPKEISRIAIPVGATIHMDGTCISAILKISILFSFYHTPFAGIETYLMAVGIALLSGMVMIGIPGGGFLGELLIISLYGFPPEALPVIAAVGTLVDPPATMVNAIGSNVVSMLMARILNGKNWLREAEEQKLEVVAG